MHSVTRIPSDTDLPKRASVVVIGGGIGIAVAGALVVRAVGREAMDSAEQATSAVPTIAAAVQHSNLLLAGVCLVSLPAVFLLRRD